MEAVQGYVWHAKAASLAGKGRRAARCALRGSFRCPMPHLVSTAEPARTARPGHHRVPCAKRASTHQVKEQQVACCVRSEPFLLVLALRLVTTAEPARTARPGHHRVPCAKRASTHQVKEQQVACCVRSEPFLLVLALRLAQNVIPESTHRELECLRVRLVPLATSHQRVAPSLARAASRPKLR